MISIIALWLTALVAPDSQITWLTVSPVSDRTEVVIRVDGTVTARDFMMDDGRLVIDITGIRQTTDVAQTVNRGGISRVRIGQFQPDIARVVVELSQPVAYSVVKEEGVIRIRLPNNGGLFEPWAHQMTRSSATTVRPPVADPSTTTTVATKKPAARQEPVRQERLLIVNYQERLLSDVLGDISAISGRTILASPKVRAQPITAEIMAPGLPWPVALETILEANGLVQRTLANGAIIVEDGASIIERAKQQTLVTTSIPLRYVNADSVARSVQGALTKDVGTAAVMSASNSLLITDTPEALERVRGVVQLLDVRPIMVEIQAKVAFIDRTTLEALGVVYDLKDSRGNQLRGLADNAVDTDRNGTIDPTEQTGENSILLGGNSIAALGNANTRVSGPSLTLATSLVLGRHTLISFLEALQTVSISDIQAQPMVAIQNHYRARLQVGERTPVRTIDASSVGNNGPRAAVSFQETGIILEVTPHVTGDQVQLEMHLERSAPVATSSDIGLTFTRQTADNVVLAMDGETIVVSGLTIIEKTKSRTGIPFLMDLPWIGALFRNDNEREAKRDLLMLVTPRIVRDQ